MSWRMQQQHEQRISVPHSPWWNKSIGSIKLLSNLECIYWLSVNCPICPHRCEVSSREDSWFSLYFHHSLRAFHSACIEDFANGSGCQVQESSFILFVIATMSLMHHVWWDGVVYYRRRNVVQNHRHPLHTLFIKLKFDAWCHTTQQAWSNR